MRHFVAIVAVGMAALVAAGCGSEEESDTGTGSGGGQAAASIETPAPLEEGGEFLFCTDVPYPPAEYQEGSKFVGYEIDIATEVADRLGTTAQFQKTGFDGIIAALLANKCDGIISSMNNTEERRAQVAFVDYMEVGQSLMVAPGSEGEIQSLEDLSGRVVAVQVGTTLKDAIDQVSAELVDGGQEAIEVKLFPDAGAAANALRGGDVDAFFGDSPVVADYVNKDEESFTFAGEPIDPLPVAIAMRPDDTELQDAVQQAIDEMYADGAMQQILEQWKVEDFMLEGGDAPDDGAGEDTAAEEE